LGALQSFTVHDAVEAWREENIDAVRTACETRGILFFFDPDSEQESDQG
jgi:hypothetical protein